MKRPPVSFAIADVGGTNTRIACYLGGVDMPIRINLVTSRSYREQLRELVGILKSKRIKKLVIGVASPIDVVTGRLLGTPNLPDYRGRHPVRDFRGHGIEAYLFNDLELAALGEAIRGAGRPYTHVAVFSLATGAGGALVSHGRIVRGRFTLEPGHHILRLARNSNNTFDSLEHLLSGTGLRKLTEKEPAHLTDRYFNTLLPHFCQALANMALFWAPEVIILVGPVANRFSHFLPQVRRGLARLITIFPPPRILAGQLGDESALQGGLLWYEQAKSRTLILPATPQVRQSA